MTGLILLILQKELGWAGVFLCAIVLFVLGCYILTLDYYFYNDECIIVKNLSGKTWQIKWKEICKIEKREIGGAYGSDIREVFFVYKKGNLKKPHLMVRGDDELLMLLKKHYTGLIFDYIDSRYL